MDSGLEGTYAVTLSITDSQLTGTDTLTIFVDNNAHNVSIVEPQSDSFHPTNSLISYSASATDGIDGVIDPQQVNWKLNLHHLNHIHVGFDNVQGYSGTFSLDYHDDETSYELQFSATSSRNITVSQSVLFDVYLENTITWLDDALPAGASTFAVNDAWSWVGTDPAFFRDRGTSVEPVRWRAPALFPGCD